MLAAWIAVLLLMLLATASFAWHRWLTRASPRGPAESVAHGQVERAYPEAGLLVTEDVLRAVSDKQVTIWAALAAADIPVAVEYHPVTDTDLAKYRAVPVNSSMQQAITGIAEAIKPESQLRV